MALPDTPVNDLTSVVPVMTLTVLDWIALIILIVGGLNWGLIGILNLDLVAAILGMGTGGTRAVYILVGLSALYCIALAWRLAGESRRRY